MSIEPVEHDALLLRDGKTNLEELIRNLPFSNIYQFRSLPDFSQRGGA
jgi:hypothetical protein